MLKLPTKKTPVLCQGITSELGTIHTERAIAYGSLIVSGTSRDKNIKNYQGIPVFHTVREAVQKTHPQISVIFSTPARALQEVEEAARAKIPLIICTTEHVPLHDILKMLTITKKYGVSLLGPSSPGIVHIGECLAGSMPAHLFPKGSVGIIGRSSSLIYEAVQQLAEEGLGISSCISLGAASLVGTSFVPVLKTLLADRRTEAILIIGQLAGQFELELAEACQKLHHKKPLIIYIPGQTIEGYWHIPLLGIESGIAEKVILEKKQALEKAKIIWVTDPIKMGKTVKIKLNDK